MQATQSEVNLSTFSVVLRKRLQYSRDGIYAHRKPAHFIRRRDPYLAIARESIHGYPKNTHAQCVAPMSAVHSYNNALVCPASPAEPSGSRLFAAMQLVTAIHKHTCYPWHGEGKTLSKLQ